MMIRFAPLLILSACGGTPTEDPRIAFRQCMAKQARALNSEGYLTYAVAKQFAESCRDKLRDLSIADQRRAFRDYTCAFSGFSPPCPPITD